MRIKSISALLILIPASICAQNLPVSIKVPQTDAYKKATLVIMPAGKSYDPKTDGPLKEGKGGTYTGSVETSKEGMYNLSVSNHEAQYTLPIYLPKGTKALTMRLTSPTLSTANNLPQPANKAFSAFQAKMSEIASTLGINSQDMSGEQIKSYLERYVPIADSISNAYKLTGTPAQYLKLWGWNSTCDSFSMASYLAGRAGKPLEFNLSDILPEASQEIDTPMAAWFYSMPMNIAASLKGGKIEDQLDNLYNNFKTPAIRQSVARVLMDRFMGSFDYTKDFEGGEQRLEEMTKKYDLPDNYLKTFRSRIATLPGAMLPNVEVEDINGNKVNLLEKFAGKYLYIDLWASWCGPCIKEVPHLQKLEKEFEGSNIAFISVSTDTDTKPWKARMEALKMHGNQFIDQAGELPGQLNVRGIPFFLLYGPDGKLIKYSMTRPSDPKTSEFLRTLP